MRRLSYIVICMLFCLSNQVTAQNPLPYISDGLLDTTQASTLGLREATVHTVTIFSPKENDYHYANGVVITAFKGKLYCMWQRSVTDEDAPETSVVYSMSEDNGKTWSSPRMIAEANDSTYCTSGGWISTNDTLIAFINIWPKGLEPKGGYVCYKETTDGEQWTTLRHVTMADGSNMNGIIEQDPTLLTSGRLISPAYTCSLSIVTTRQAEAAGIKGILIHRTWDTSPVSWNPANMYAAMVRWSWYSGTKRERTAS